MGAVGGLLGLNGGVGGTGYSTPVAADLVKSNRLQLRSLQHGMALKVL